MQAYSRAAIRTKFIPSTNSRGARIKARCQAGSVSIPYPYGADTTEAHWEAVRELLSRKGLTWGNRWAVGSADPSGFVFTPIVDGANVIDLEG